MVHRPTAKLAKCGDQRHKRKENLSNAARSDEDRVGPAGVAAAALIAELVLAADSDTGLRGLLLDADSAEAQLRRLSNAPTAESCSDFEGTPDEELARSFDSACLPRPMLLRSRSSLEARGWDETLVTFDVLESYVPRMLTSEGTPE